MHSSIGIGAVSICQSGADTIISCTVFTNSSKVGSLSNSALLRNPVRCIQGRFIWLTADLQEMLSARIPSLKLTPNSRSNGYCFPFSWLSYALNSSALIVATASFRCFLSKSHSLLFTLLCLSHSLAKSSVCLAFWSRG